MFVCVREFRTRYSSFLSAMCQWQYDFFCQQGYLRTDQAPAQKKLSGVVRSLQIVHSGKVFTISKTIPGGSQFWMFSFWKGECNNMLYTVHRALPGAQSRRKRNSMRDFQSPSPAWMWRDLPAQYTIAAWHGISWQKGLANLMTLFCLELWGHGRGEICFKGTNLFKGTTAGYGKRATIGWCRQRPCGADLACPGYYKMPNKTAEAPAASASLSLCRCGFTARPLMKMAGSTLVTLGAFACTRDKQSKHCENMWNKMLHTDWTIRSSFQSMVEKDQRKHLRSPHMAR